MEVNRARKTWIGTTRHVDPGPVAAYRLQAAGFHADPVLRRVQQLAGVQRDLAGFGRFVQRLRQRRQAFEGADTAVRRLQETRARAGALFVKHDQSGGGECAHGWPDSCLVRLK